MRWNTPPRRHQAAHAADTIDEMEHVDTTAKATSKAVQLLVALDRQMHIVDEIKVAIDEMERLNTTAEATSKAVQLLVALDRQMHIVDEIKAAIDEMERLNTTAEATSKAFRLLVALDNRGFYPVLPQVQLLSTRMSFHAYYLALI
ncbi:hypothetical protein KC360_g6870 [Hortaea werneckii]|nr:hypothetical protein KC325_g6882 [Hortaea werneckii]KAI7000470.1 hypothetical protein KC359_g1144 [Hortaea werneckii]KAI7142071.1 hypothetical protein KC344_g7505 [Hortaea werneckii]KAI7170386.1 hypothetical protein KC360_g6870 [Hortaea werneckii]